MRYTLRVQQSLLRKHIIAFVVAAVGVAALGGFLYHVVNQSSDPATPAAIASSPQREKVVSTASGVSTNMLFVGDVFWGRYVQRRAEASGQGPAFLTTGLSQADRASYNAWIANFECPVTTKDIPYQQQLDYLKFNCRPEYLRELSRWFTAGSLANNHTMNNGGQWGLQQTRQNLSSAGMQYFGNYDMTKTGDICEVITMPATELGTEKSVHIPVALCGYMYVVNVEPTETQLAVMQRYARVMPVIAMPHMGLEYRTTAESAKESAYRRMIDSGADAVIGAHPHVIQNSETYKGKLIAYSLGNFLFDQQSVSRDTTLGFAVGIKLTVTDPNATRVYEQVAPSCAVFKDDCLATLEGQLTQRPRITVAYRFACYDESSSVGGVPTLGGEAACALAKKRATTIQLQDLAKQW